MQIKPTAVANVGQTWSNAPLNIDLDNLMSNKSKSSNALSMNQLKMQSPVKQQQSPVPPMLSPPLHINNNAVNNNFNSLNNNIGGSMFSPAQQPQQQQQQQGNMQSNQQPFYGNLMATVTPNANNLNNQFNAFQ